MNIQEFKSCLDNFDVTQQEQLSEIISKYHYIMILGNGGSNSIASHIAQDYTKKLGKRAVCFSDPSMLTCYSNDYGYHDAFKMFVQHYMLQNTLLILISSSGNSQNILNAAQFAMDKADMITLSGFEPNNYLRAWYGPKSLMHFYVPSKDYGIVENMHQIILHSVI